MALTEMERLAGAQTWAKRVFVKRNETAKVNASDIKAAFDAVDGWVDAAQASFNAALPEPFKSTATAEQKALMLVYVVMKRTRLI